MIRYIQIGDKNSVVDGPFALYNTRTQKFIELDGNQVFSSEGDLIGAYVASGPHPVSLERLRSKIPRDRRKRESGDTSFGEEPALKWEDMSNTGRKKPREGDVRLVNLNVHARFSWSDKIIDEYDHEEGKILGYRSGFVMELLPASDIPFEGQENMYLYSPFKG